MMIDPRVVRVKHDRSRGQVVRRVALSLLAFAALGTAVAVRDLGRATPGEPVRQSAAAGPYDGPVWSDKVVVVTSEKVGS